MGTIKEMVRKKEENASALQKWIRWLSFAWLCFCFAFVCTLLVMGIYGEHTAWVRIAVPFVAFAVFSMSTGLWFWEMLFAAILGFLFKREKCVGLSRTGILPVVITVMMCFRLSRVIVRYTLLLMLPWLMGWTAAFLFELIMNHRERIQSALRRRWSRLTETLSKAAAASGRQIRPFLRKHPLICLGVLALWQMFIAFAPHAFTVLYAADQTAASGLAWRVISICSYVTYHVEQTPALLWPTAVVFGIWCGCVSERGMKFAVCYSILAAGMFGAAAAVFVLHKLLAFGFINGEFLACAWAGQTICWILGMSAAFLWKKGANDS